MARGGRRDGAGRPKDSKSQGTLAKEAAREHVRQRITAELDPIIDGAIQRAKGLSYLVTRDGQTGRFVRVTHTGIGGNRHRSVEKEPDMAAIRELLDRALDKSKEQEQKLDMHMTGDVDKFVARIKLTGPGNARRTQKCGDDRADRIGWCCMKQRNEVVSARRQRQRFST